jgi:ATP synthase protein I
MNSRGGNREPEHPDARRRRRGIDLKAASGAGLASTVGITIVVATVIGYLLGHWLDKKLGTDPVFVVILVLLGGGAGMYEAYRVAARMSEDDSK